MSYVKEDFKHEEFDISIQVLEKTKDEATYEEGTIIGIEFDTMNEFSPAQLISIGNWFIKEGVRIGKEYTKTGKKK